MFKYIAVGVLNTLISLLTIWFCMLVLKIAYDVSNIIGYIIGFINSFIWNKIWVFRKKGSKNLPKELILFLSVFIVCYLIQFIGLKIMVEQFHWNEYLSQLLAMILYTIPGYLLNRFITFSDKKERNIL
ncbi:MAG: GtrA family protein [Bacteroidales bacterium]|nr:GtrA family protein [Bacteroidales bacterium]